MPDIEHIMRAPPSSPADPSPLSAALSASGRLVVPLPTLIGNRPRYASATIVDGRIRVHMPPQDNSDFDGDDFDGDDFDATTWSPHSSASAPTTPLNAFHDSTTSSHGVQRMQELLGAQEHGAAPRVVNHTPMPLRQSIPSATTASERTASSYGVTGMLRAPLPSIGVGEGVTGAGRGTIERIQGIANALPSISYGRDMERVANPVDGAYASRSLTIHRMQSPMELPPLFYHGRTAERIIATREYLNQTRGRPFGDRSPHGNDPGAPRHPDVPVGGHANPCAEYAEWYEMARAAARDWAERRAARVEPIVESAEATTRLLQETVDEQWPFEDDFGPREWSGDDCSDMPPLVAGDNSMEAVD